MLSIHDGVAMQIPARRGSFRKLALMMAVPALVGILDGCAFRTKPLDGRLAASDTVMQVALSRVADTSSGISRGLTNIFFDSVSILLRDSIRVSSEWAQLQIADVVAGPGLKSIRILRFSSNTGRDTTYLLDVAGSLNFLDASPLRFTRLDKVRIASVSLSVRGDRGLRRSAPYQIIVADDRYTYARIPEYRAGAITIDGTRFSVVVRNRSRNHPFFSLDAGTVFLVDQDGDGTLAEQATLTVRGVPAAAEQVMPLRPFLLNGVPYEVAGIDSLGSVMRFRRSVRSTAVSPTFRAPELVATQLDGGDLRLAAMRGRVVVLQFWATECVFSERVREAANQLVATSGDALSWLAIGKGGDLASMQQHLSDHPMGGTVALADSATWSVYNPELATPHFVVIDQSGTVTLVATGATAMSLVSQQVTRLVADR